MDVGHAPNAMVVDDDALIVMEVCDILCDIGFDCVEAYSGSEAIAALEEQAENITLLFSDVNMPGAIDGFDLARHVATHWPWIEIVLASGMVLPKANAMPNEATFIAKPFNKRTVRAHLGDTMPEGKRPFLLKRSE